MSDTKDGGNERLIKCICGSENIEHSHDNRWHCEDCGRFHTARQMDNLADRARLAEVMNNADN